MTYIDLDAELAALSEAPAEALTVKLGGVDHAVEPLGVLEKMRLTARFTKSQDGSLSGEDMAYLADLLPRLVPTASAYLESITDPKAFSAVLKAILEDGESSPNVSTASAGLSPVPSEPTAEHSEPTP